MYVNIYVKTAGNVTAVRAVPVRNQYEQELEERKAEEYCLKHNTSFLWEYNYKVEPTFPSL